VAGTDECNSAPMGTNMKRLMVERAAQLAVDRASLMGGDMMAAMCYRISEGSISRDMRDAKEWALAAVRVVRDASEPNKWCKASDEEIAAEILRQVAAAKGIDGSSIENV
jgi:hypothetical protein